MTDAATKARAAGYMPRAVDSSGQTFLSRDSQWLLSAEAVVKELEAEERDQDDDAAH